MNSLTKEMRLEQLMPLIRERLAAGQTVSFSPRGVSMRPMLRQGIDSVELAPISGQLKKYDLPLYQRDNGQYVLHRIVGVTETYCCVGDNQFDLEYGVRHDQLIALVTSFTRGSKRISVTNVGYRIYCRFWCTTRPVRHLWRRALGRIKRIAKTILGTSSGL